MYVCMCAFLLINVIGIVGVTSVLQFLSSTGPCACPVCTVRAGYCGMYVPCVVFVTHSSRLACVARCHRCWARLIRGTTVRRCAECRAEGLSRGCFAGGVLYFVGDS